MNVLSSTRAPRRELGRQVDRDRSAQRLADNDDLVGGVFTIINQPLIRGPGVEFEARFGGASFTLSIAAIVDEEHIGTENVLPARSDRPPAMHIATRAMKKEHHRTR